jgi:hypothetical protein
MDRKEIYETLRLDSADLEYRSVAGFYDHGNERLGSIQHVPKMYTHTLDAHNSYASVDRIIVFCSDILE